MGGERWKARKRRPPKRNKESTQETLSKALNHEVRVKALGILGDRIASPSEIAEEIEMPLANVSYHVGVLEELGLVDLVEEESVRGSVAHFYKATERPPDGDH
jgi:DNA-binding transcriptional ArsR family regulator